MTNAMDNLRGGGQMRGGGRMRGGGQTTYVVGMGNLLDLHDSPLSHFAIPSVDTHKMDDWWMTYERTTYVTDDL